MKQFKLPIYQEFLLQQVLKNPEFSFRRLTNEINRRSFGFFQPKPHIVYLLLRSLKLNSKKQRLSFVRKRKIIEIVKGCPDFKTRKKNGELSQKARELLLKASSQKIQVKEVCSFLKVSRTTYYKWKKRQKNGESLSSKVPEINFYFRQTPYKIESQIVSIVIKNPRLSLPKIATLVPKKRGRPVIGYYGIQRVLERNNLNTLARRVTYSKAFAKEPSPVSLPKTVFFPIYNMALKIYRMILAPFVTIPKMAFQSYIFKFFLITFVTTFVFAYYWINLLSKSQSTSHTLGLILASLSLTIGLIFFLYSIKYYLTIALVLAYSRHNRKEDSQKESYKGGLQPDLSQIILSSHPFISIHIASYNEKRVIDRLLTAVTQMDYPYYEVILIDDSNDPEAIAKISSWKGHPRLKIIQRQERTGFKGGALEVARKATDPKAEFILVFDADFIPYPDTITQFLKYFKAIGIRPEVAAIQGYQWHVLNKSENWITRGVRSEYAGSYVIERSGTEIYSGIKQVAGSVFMIKRNVLDQFGWGSSITEDYQLTLKLYEKGYKVVYTPYIQAPSECVSTVKRLIRQRMRWAEGHSHNVKKMFVRLLTSSKLANSEKFEFLYLSPYYLQSALFVAGTLSWFMAEVIFKVRLPFWTAVWGWSLVITNMLSLPLMNLVGLFLEESEERDYLGLFSFIFLSYILAPFQGYAAIKGFLEKEEGPWFRTPKTGRITDVFERGRFYRWFSGIITWKPAVQPIQTLRLRSGQATLPSPYFALATANNQFNSFNIRPRKRMRIVARSILAFLLIIVISLSYFSFYATGFTVIAEEKRFSSYLDPKLFDVPKDYKLIESKTTYPTLENGNNYWLRINGGNVDPKYETYDGYLNRIYNIDNSQSTNEFSFILELSDNLYLKDSDGGYVLLKDKETDTDQFMLRNPQGIDSKNQRVDYGYYPNGTTLTLRPKNLSQFEKASYPVKVYAPINSVLWYEAIVQVGENCADSGCGKDGDLLDIRPAGWFWGIEERKQNVIVKVPKVTNKERKRILARTLRPIDPNDDMSPENKELAKKAVIADEDKERVFTVNGLSRFGIDYTALTSSKELALIRDKEKDSPVLDARYSSNIIAMKNNPLLSVIPDSNRLAYKPLPPPGLVKRIWSKIAPPVHAVTTVTKSIGSAGGRDYSTITLWEAGQQGVLTTLDEIHKGEAYKDSDFAEQVTIDGSTTDATRYMWLTAASGQQHNGTAGTGVKMNPTSLTANRATNYVIIYVLDTNTLIEWFEITETVSSSDDGTTLHGIHFDTGGGGTARNNLIYKLDARTGQIGIEFNDVPVNIYNNIIYDMELQGAGTGRGVQTWITSTGGTASIYNNTSHSNGHHGYNIQTGAGGTLNLKNNIATSNGIVDYTFPWVPGTENCSNNLSSDATADDNGCTSAQISKTTANQFVSITGGSENLHLKTGSDAIDVGTSLSGTFTNDIDNDTRPIGAAWDIGADEIPENLWSFILLAPFFKGFLKKIKKKSKRKP